jgi:hypothetical protein
VDDASHRSVGKQDNDHISWSRSVDPGSGLIRNYYKINTARKWSEASPLSHLIWSIGFTGNPWIRKVLWFMDALNIALSHQQMGEE